MTPDFAEARRAMVDSQLRPEAVSDPRILAAMARVPREAFVPQASAAIAYIDRPVALGDGRFLTPPASLGRLLTELAPRAGERALVVAAATGYAAAILADMGLEVVALEEHPGLTARLRNVAGLTVVEGPLADGAAPHAPFDLILVDGEVGELPQALVDQLAEGGRLGLGRREQGVCRLARGVRSLHGFGMTSFADAPMPPLAAFARTPAFTF